MNNFIGQATNLLNLKWTGELSKDTYRNLFDEQTCLLIEAKAAELQAAEPMRLLRLERNRLLQETDWRFRIDQEPSQAWYEYCQELRDLPANSDPQLDENGMLTNVVWPTKPSENV